MTLPFSTISPGIGGQIKRRYSDFIVEEVAVDGRVSEVKRYDREPLPPFEPMDIPEKPDREVNQLHLDLEKSNTDLQWVIKQTTRFLQDSKKRFGYAGLKDKRGITCQRVSLFDPNLERLKKFHARGFYFRNPEWRRDRIEIGDLRGNRFRIVVRDIDLSEDEIRSRFRAFAAESSAHGIANYFGEQRFGGMRNVTHLVGKKIIQNDFEGAVMTYLTLPSEGEDESTAAIRLQLAHDRDFGKALQHLDPKFRTERAMLSHLNVHPSDFVGAIQQLPKAMRYLFTHAYQSHLFNEMLARRLTPGIGLAAIPRDQLDEKGVPMLPLIGHETILDDSPAGKMAAEILAEEGISTSQFRIVRGLPEATSKGGQKAISLFAQDLNLVKIEDDPFYPGKKALSMSFELPKGCYGTTVLAELQKIPEG